MPSVMNGVAFALACRASGPRPGRARPNGCEQHPGLRPDDDIYTGWHWYRSIRGENGT